MVAAAPAPADATAGRLRPRLWTLPGVRVFAAGVARGQQWTEADIDAMVRNGKLFGHLVRPTVVIGHEETQPLTAGMPATATQNTGQPAYGRAVNLRKEKTRDGTFLAADFKDVPTWLARMIAGKSYVDRSAEIYEQPPDGLEQAKGPILRRVSLLGGELPQIKTLGELPEPEVQEYAEQPTWAVRRRPLRVEAVERRGRSCVVRFSERPATVKTCKRYADLSEKSRATMKRFADATAGPPDAPAAAPEGVSRQDMLDMLADLGVDVSVITDATPDEVLAEWVRSASGQAAPDAAPDEPAAPKDQMADDATATITPPATPDPTTMNTPAPGAPQPSSVTIKYSELAALVSGEVKKALAGQSAEVAAIRQFTEKELADRQKAGVQAFVELKVKEGKVLPAEREGLIEQAMLLDAVKVHKFSDGDMTPLAKWQKTIDGRPVLLSFHERMKAGPDGADAKDAEEAKVRRHAAAIAAPLAAAGLTPEKYVQRFSEARKKDPALTAERYGVPATA